MVSRRKILSRSRDDLNLDQTFSPQEEEEDVWYQKDKLYKEHIQEVLDKWTQIDDEIWAKVIVFERNRRVAKAYARAPVLTINGSDDGFDGMRIGLCGFDNPMRDQKTDEFKRHIGQGVKIKMDDAGNILIRRYAKSNVYIKSTASNSSEETSIGADILKLPNQALESEKIVKLFDMKKFQSNVNRELRRAYPDRRRLETQCLSTVAFVKSENDILECPIWVLIVNVVAMDMLKSKLPPVQRPMVDIKNRPRIPIPDEDPYSVAGNGSGGSSGSSGFGANNGHHQQSAAAAAAVAAAMANGNGVVAANMHLNNVNNMNGNNSNTGHVAATREQLLLQTQQLAHKRSEKPPKLPPRDNIYAHDIIPKPDYDDIDVETRIKLSRGKSDKGKDNKKYDDPYYCGLRARVPNFVKSSKPPKDHAINGLNGSNVHNGSSNASIISNNNNIGTLSQKKTSMIHHPMHPAMPVMHAPPPPHMHPHHLQQQQMMAVAAAHAVHHPAAAAAAAAAAHHHHQHQMWQTRSFESGIGIYSQHHLSATSATNFILEHNQAAPPPPPSTLPTTAALLTATNTPAAAAAAIGDSGTTTTTTATDKTAAAMTTTMTNTGSTDKIATATELGRPNQLSKHMTRYGQQHQHPHHHHHHHHHRHGHAHNNCSHRSGVDYYQPQRQRQRQQQQHLPLLDQYALESTECHQQLARRTNNNHSPQRAPTRSTGGGVTESNCNCMSCYTLAPLFGAVAPPRPPRSLSQQQLRQHQRLGGLIDTPPPLAPTNSSNVVRWCSESDISLVERERAFGDYGDDNDDSFAGFSGGRLKPYSNSERNDRRNNDDFDNGDDYNFSYDPDMDLDELESSTYDALQPPKLLFSRRQQKSPSNPIYGGLRHGIAPSPLQKRQSNAIYMNNNSNNNNKKTNRMLANRETQTQNPLHQFELHQRSPPDIMDVDDNATFLTDSYVDTRAASRLRQQPQRIKGTALWATRQKSLSTESFFEQPNEEGTLYLYGGRQRIPKAPSTTNIYDRVRNSLETSPFQQHLENQRRRFNSQLNLNASSNPNFNPGQRQWSNRVAAAVRREQQNGGVMRDVNNNNINSSFNNNNDGNRAMQPKLPAPCWQRGGGGGGGKRNGFFMTPIGAAATKRQYNNSNNNNNTNNLNRLDMKNRHNNNNKMCNMSTKQSNCDKQEQQQQQQQQQQLNNEMKHKTDLNKNLKQQQQLRHNMTNNITSNINNVGSNITNISNNKTINNNSQDKQNNNSSQQTQEQQLEQQQQRTSRPSRIDISDMESIYGYLKPRKPRSLSLKKIQILDY